MYPGCEKKDDNNVHLLKMVITKKVVLIQIYN
jgi:hypothetical protein